MVPPPYDTRSSNSNTIHRRHTLLVIMVCIFNVTHGFVPFVGRTVAATTRSSRPLSTTTPLFALVDDITTAMKTAMKAKDTTTLKTVRLIRSAFANAAIELRTEALNDEQAQVVLKKMAKMRKESIDMFEKGGAIDRAEEERAELRIIEQWLPTTVTDETIIRQWAQEAIAVVGSADNVGKVMGAFMKQHKADVDGGLAQQIVKDEIAKMKEQQQAQG